LRKKLRVGFASLWSSIPGQALTIDRYETRIAGQASGGRPDITGYTGFEPEVVTLLVENKFGAPRTRMQANLDYLCDLDEGGLLLFIVPDNRRGEFYSFIRAAPDLAVGPDAQGIDPENSVRWQKTQDNKVIAVAGWQAVIRALESGISDKESATSEHTQIDDELKDLRRFCGRRAAMEFYEPLPSTDVTGLQIPQFLMSVMTLIDSAVEEAHSRRVLETEAQPSDENKTGRSYGYDIQLGFDSHGKKLEAWFGVYLEAWRRNGQSPIWLQFYDEAADQVKSPLSAFGGLYSDDEKEWLCPVRVKAGVPEYEAIESLVNGLAEVKAALGSSGVLLPVA
jgi:hypothetical protein